jgi:hypothetical protein
MATLDLGGGSFQLAVGTRAKFEDGKSTQVGSNIILDTVITPFLANSLATDPAAQSGIVDAKAFAHVDAWLKANAPMPVDVAKLSGRTLVATGGVSKFMRAHFGKDVISRAEIDALRREVGALPVEQRTALVTKGKSDEQKVALGIDTPEGALDYGKKLPASASLLLHILTSIGADEVRVSETDVRHLLIQSARS